MSTIVNGVATTASAAAVGLFGGLIVSGLGGKELPQILLGVGAGAVIGGGATTLLAGASTPNGRLSLSRRLPPPPALPPVTPLPEPPLDPYYANQYQAPPPAQYPPAQSPPSDYEIQLSTLQPPPPHSAPIEVPAQAIPPTPAPGYGAAPTPFDPFESLKRVI